MEYTKDKKMIREQFMLDFEKIMKQRLLNWKVQQSEARKKLYSEGAILSYIAIPLLAFCPARHEHNYDIKTHCVLYAIIFIANIIANIHKTNKRYQESVKNSFFEDIIKIFGAGIHYSCPSENKYQIPKMSFEKTKLFDQGILSTKCNIDYIHYDDKFSGTYKDVNFKVNEVNFGYCRTDSRGRKSEISLFKGLALYFKFNKTIKNRVQIVSKYRFYIKPKNFEKVELEYNKFSKKYNVWVEVTDTGAASAQVEARYFLNSAFIDRFMQLQTSFKVSKIQCSIYKNDLYIFLSTFRDLFEMNHLLGKIDDPKQYNRLFDQFASIFSFIDVLNLSSNTKL